MFVTPYDIANRAIQHLGGVLISTFADNSKNAAQAGFLYDKIRRAELRANPWNFSRRRAVLRPLTNPSFIITFAAWNNATVYNLGDIVSNNQAIWVSLIQGNVGNTPTSGFPWTEYTGATIVPAWAPGPYYSGELTVSPGGFAFINFVNGNTAPAGGGSGTPAGGTINEAAGWHAVGFVTVTNNLGPLVPLGYTTNLLPNSSKNVYSLPPAYLRNMMQDPKVAGTPAQITTGGSQALDYEIEQGCLLTAAPGPIIFRFGADLQLVSWFDDLFCEALAARMAVELNETITQSPQKAQICNGLYEEAIAKAIRVNAIEAGSTEPDGDKVDSQRGPTREKVAPQPQQRQ